VRQTAFQYFGFGHLQHEGFSQPQVASPPPRYSDVLMMISEFDRSAPKLVVLSAAVNMQAAIRIVHFIGCVC
jgi:hypothetical protein